MTASAQYDAKQIAFEQSSMVNKSIDPAAVQRERHWCHQQALFRNTSVDKVSPYAAPGRGCSTSFSPGHRLVTRMRESR